MFHSSDLPFSSDFGDLETKVHGVEIGRLPFEDVVTSPGLVSLQGQTINPPKIRKWKVVGAEFIF